ncbi:uncharacterized protein LOC113206758 [Frankliniella occidentalis]|uniref:Uncharacterized protein LOC113206758 n=1 Tax=Frankliniella occidentalis TaxID=133901 RepID=A0A9C6X9N7_FRAOC|nr:uncharacterized protein LOC113206758 [Frankliniella occidentalis]
MFGAARPGVRRYPRSSWWFHLPVVCLVLVAQAPFGLQDNTTAVLVDDVDLWNVTLPGANDTLLWPEGLLENASTWTPSEDVETSPSFTPDDDITDTSEATTLMDGMETVPDVPDDPPEAMMVADEPWPPDEKDFAQVVFSNKAKPVKDAILLLREKLRRPDLVVPDDDDDQAVHGLQVLDRTADPAIVAGGGVGVVEQGAESLVLDASAQGPGGVSVALPPGGLGHLDDDDHNPNATGNGTLHGWPMKLASVVEGDLVLGGLMMVHERHDRITCGPIMPQVRAGGAKVAHTPSGR